ncbi:MAG TPA: DUF2585 family protein [Hyphomicrobiaceae bacterium]|nr:DUF2585 family protein [Hyphomicrobiaceae bacterium]
MESRWRIQNFDTVGSWGKVLAGIVVVLAVQMGAMWAMGRLAICKCGYVKFWHGVVQSSENSQHIADWYTFSHVLHGLIFYFVIRLLLPRLSFAWGLLLAFVIEGAWEVVENTPYVIDRYRSATAAFDYFGDTLVNSFADSIAMAVGFVMARLLPVWASVVFLIAVEVLLALGIRDNLTLNIIMLLYPIEAIKRWQLGG